MRLPAEDELVERAVDALGIVERVCRTSAIKRDVEVFVALVRRHEVESTFADHNDVLGDGAVQERGGWMVTGVSLGKA